MEKDIDKIPKNPDTDIVIRIDDFGGKRGLTIREFVRGERYTGFTKAGTRIPVEHFKAFKDAINSIDEAELTADLPVNEGGGADGGQGGLDNQSGDGGGSGGDTGGEVGDIGGAESSGQSEVSGGVGTGDIKEEAM